MTRRNQLKLTTQELVEFSLAALASSRRLFDDADLLRRSERRASAFVLLGLAADELGKHILVASFVTRDQTEKEWRKFWSRLGRHTEKLGDSLLIAMNEYLALVSTGSIEWDESVLKLITVDEQAFHTARLGSTYVDWNDDARSVTSPDSVASPDLVDGMFEIVRAGLEYSEKLFRSQDAASLGRLFETLRGSEKQRLLANSTQFLAYRQATLSGAAHENAVEFARLMDESFTRAEEEMQAVDPSLTTVDLDDSRLAEIVLEVFQRALRNRETELHKRGRR